MKDKLDITLRVANVKLSLTIKPEEEELLREVAKEVNHAYESYQQRFSGTTAEETLAKVTLLFAKGYINLMSQTKQLESTLNGFEAHLDKLLQTNFRAGESDSGNHSSQS